MRAAVGSRIVCHIFVSAIMSTSLTLVVTTSNREAFMTTPELVKFYNYPLESHKVMTDDQYILTHHRIPFGLDGPGTEKRVPVLMQHGLVGDSSGWLLNYPNKSIGFLLANAGYDVWLLNSRGSIYSKEHAKLSSRGAGYWDFSWHQMGVYDFPATIDYILNVTGSKQVAHIGHSQGTTALYVLLSERPEYNSKISLHIGYAPVAYHFHSKNPLFRFLSLFEKTGILSTPLFRSFNLVPHNSITVLFLVNACSNWMATKIICEMLYYAMMGYNPTELDRSRLAIIYGHYPSNSAMMQFTHFVQGVNKPLFAKFDYKEKENRNLYGTSTPPEYNLTNVRVPVFNFYGDRDAFVQLPDVRKLHSQLPNLVERNFIKKWAHYDFLFGVHAYDNVYKPTLEILNQNL